MRVLIEITDSEISKLVEQAYKANRRCCWLRSTVVREHLSSANHSRQACCGIIER
jgi:hypothetical protein